MNVEVKIDPEVKDTEVLITAEKKSRFLCRLVDVIQDFDKSTLLRSPAISATARTWSMWRTSSESMPRTKRNFFTEISEMSQQKFRLYQ